MLGREITVKQFNSSRSRQIPQYGSIDPEIFWPRYQEESQLIIKTKKAVIYTEVCLNFIDTPISIPPT